MSSSNFRAQGHLKEMERWNESFRHFMEEFELCLMMLVLKAIFATECASTATFYDNIIVKNSQNESSLELM
jgi:hypothetical protein